MSYKVKTIISSNSAPISSNSAPTDDVLSLPTGEFPRDYDDVALFHSTEYAKIFGEKRTESCDEQKLLSVVKITYGGKSIHRAYRCSPKLRKDEVGLSSNSQRLLFGKNDNAGEVTITKGSKFLYFWNHPFHATRISMRLGVYSVILAILSTILAIVSIIIAIIK